MRRHVDYPFLAIVCLLTVAGLLVISSVSVVISQKNFSTPYYYLGHQSLAALLGLAALLVAQAVPYKLWRKLALPLLAVSLLLMAAVFLPKLGFSYGGASRWLTLGPISIQPSEILKLSLILYLAGWLDKKKGESKRLATAFVPFLTIVGIVGILLALQRDVGTLLVIGGSAVILYFLGGGRVSQLVTFAILAAIGLFALVQIEPYRVQRLAVFFNPGQDPQGSGYHISQALIAIGSGGFFGRGFGQSIQKYNYLPEPIGDSVFAVIVEEFGFFGGLLVAAIFFGLFFRAILIARRAPDFFGKLVAAGIASLITLQVFINLAAISGLLPLTGIPLPFFSYGGTSLVMTLAMCGIILNVSKRAA